MDDVQNGSYLLAGGIWAELNRRKSFACYAAVKNLLSRHLTRTLYNDSRADIIQLISRKISRKEYLIKRQDDEFTEQLHKQIASVESEISTLLAFVKAFDRMADFLENETAAIVDEWYKSKQLNSRLNLLLDGQIELSHSWSETAFKLYGDYIQQLAQPTLFTNA